MERSNWENKSWPNDLQRGDSTKTIDPKYFPSGRLKLLKILHAIHDDFIVREIVVTIILIVIIILKIPEFLHCVYIVYCSVHPINYQPSRINGHSLLYQYNDTQRYMLNNP